MSDTKPPHCPLTPEEAHIIEHKGTEQPFTGEYNDHFRNGLYVCRRCEAPLYRSFDKFDSGCGWPSFDDELSNAIYRLPDADGRRTEILCRACDAHLGHVFLGEKKTEKDTRHCVNSLSMRFLPFDTLLTRALQNEKHLDVIFVAGGCFWGIEYYYELAEGVLATAVGYCGGETTSPTYSAVCRGDTGHAETVAVIFDTRRVTVNALYQLFFEIHDSTQVNRQGPDIGPQYRSEIFTVNEVQREVVQSLIQVLKDRQMPVATQVTPYGRFWLAEVEHEHYYRARGDIPTCHIRHKLFNHNDSDLTS